MIKASSIRKGMAVRDPQGRVVGHIDDVEHTPLKLERRDSADNQHHYIGLESVARVDHDVHLSAAGAAALATSMSGARGTAQVAGPATANNGLRKLLPWLLLAAGIVALLLALSRCSDRDAGTGTQAPTNDSMAVTTAPRVERVALPGGATLELEPDTLNYSLQQFLASDAPAPRTFVFDKLNFDTSSAAIRPADQGNVNALAQILSAYPNARATVTGYADARGSTGANANLGAERAAAVVGELTAKGVAASALKSTSGGESNPKDSNSTAQGQFENRRSELTITAK